MKKLLNFLPIFRKKIWNVIEKYKYYFFIIVITGISLYMRFNLMDFESGDYKIFLFDWFNRLKDNGGLKALNLNIGDYDTPYMVIMAIISYIPKNPLYLIKIVSIIFDYICAILGVKIVNLLLKDNKNREILKLLVYSFIICLPTVLLNASCWAQADSIYTAFIFMSLYALMKNKYTTSFIFIGIAFSFKLQTVFILPIYILMYISQRKFSVLNFIIIPIVNCFMCIPSMICGKSFIDCMMVYVNQTNTYNGYISMNFPNLYSIIFPATGNLISVPNEIFPKLGILYTIFVFIILAGLVIYKKIKFSSVTIIEFSLWSILIATFILPHMHDRYLFIADILAVIYAMLDKKGFIYAIGIQIISLYTYISYLFGFNLIKIQYIGILFFAILVYYSVNMYKKYFFYKDNTMSEKDEFVETE